MYKYLSGFVALGAVTMVFAAPSLAKNSERSEVGHLSCDISAGIGRIIGSKDLVNCTFTPSRPGRREDYTASIERFDLNLAVTKGNKMVWTVYAPIERPFGALAGAYRGANAEAKATVGGGPAATVLVGGSDRSVILQPAPVQQQTNLAAGVARLELRRGW